MPPSRCHWCVELAEQLYASLDEPFDAPEVVGAEWNAEIVRRVREIRSGTVECVSHEAVRAQFKL